MLRYWFPNSEVALATEGETDENTQRPSFDKYPAWLSSELRVKPDLEKNRYERESVGIVRAAQRSPLWLAYQRSKAELADRYLASTTYPLFVESGPEEVLRKPWSSFLHKTYRHNVSRNENWPNEPPEGWLAPNNWFQDVHDIARTTIVVKYLDGVATVTKAFDEMARQETMDDFRCEFEARETGYYAAHMRAGVDFPLLDTEWSESRVHGQFEVQVTTQLQEVIRRLTHREYENRRSRDQEPELKWQWDYGSDSFTPNYLGHILHYMEGMIMEVRERGKGNHV
ncbi:hypothetical protein BH10ACT7_BH10ACT7_31800 [soil metagenome]